MKKKLALVFISLLILSMLFTACSPAEAETVAEPEQESEAAVEDEEEPLKIALMLSSPVTDSGWNATAYEGLLEAEERFGAEISLSESIPTSDNEAVFRDYASRGYDLIIGQSFSFGEAAMKVAPDFPDTKFVITTGIWEAENVTSYNPMLEDYFLSGILDGLMTQTGKIGIIGGVDIPSMRACVNAIQDGARLVNPDVEFAVSYVGSWADPAKAKELALAQIESGVDVIDGSTSTSFIGIVEAVKEATTLDGNPVMVVGDVVLNTSLAPANIISAHVQNFDGMVLYFAEAVANGTFDGQIYRPTLEAGLTDVLPSDLVPADIQEQLAMYKQQIIDGEISFTEKYE